MNVQSQEEQLKRARIWKRVRIALFLVALSVVVFAVLFPVFAWAEQNRQHRIRATGWLTINILEVRQTEQGALLIMKPRRQRSFRIRLEGSRTGEEIDFFSDANQPLPVLLRPNSQFSLSIRHFSASYRVLSISSEGVTIEILGTAAWRTKNKEITLSWS